MAISKKRVIKYTLLPEVLPRIGKLFGTGFYHMAFLIALVFQSVRLLPKQHPYLDSRNLGRFGIRHVISEAYRNLKFTRGNIDQTIIFFTIIAGLVLLMFQAVLFGASFIAHPLYAATFSEWFVIPSTNYAFDEERDIALMVLDRVFGVGNSANTALNIFDSCVARNVACTDHWGVARAQTAVSFPYPIHLALHDLFRFYSIGISILSLMIIMYFVTTIVGETAVTGTPFGQRFNRAWAPVRLVLFFALIAPLNIGEVGRSGLNGAQLITLYTAKFGSNFATNAWGLFNNTTARTYYTPDQLIAVPNPPDFSYLAQFYTIVHACVHAEKLVNNVDVKTYLVRDSGTTLPGPAISSTTAHPNALDMTDGSAVSSFEALRFTMNSSAKIVYGIQGTGYEYDSYAGNVIPKCGIINVPVVTVAEPGAEAAFRFYFNLINMYSLHTSTGVTYAGNAGFIHNLGTCYMNRNLTIVTESCNPMAPYPTYIEGVENHINTLRTDSQQLLWQIHNNQAGFGNFAISDDLLRRGWGGAAIWYNRIAQMNGAIVSAVNATPEIRQWPMLMEEVKRAQQEHSATTIGSQLFSINLPPRPDDPQNQIVDLDGSQDYEMARTYYELFKFWQDNTMAADPDTAITQNPIIDTINTIFGTNALFDMRLPAIGGGSSHTGNANVHPLALLSALGRSILEASIRNLGIAAGGTLGGGLMNILGMGNSAGAAAIQTATSFLGTVAMSTILIGFMLYYVLPFMPFLYFFFALGGWVKSIFEAMVAMPIWALAHIRIDGEGLPGPGASNGYFLLLEIFIRPILIFIGLISSIIIFGAMVQILNQTFDMVVHNVAGNARVTPDPTAVGFYRGPVDELFFSIMYAAICYMMGLSCFKMIDQVPNNILRWMGVSVSTFKETSGDQVSQISSTVYQKGNLVMNQLSGNVGRAAAIIGGGR